ncbi:MAG: restriction endonuclease subunit S [Verrucomicrobiae bacterium]
MKDEWPKVKLADVAGQCLGKMLDAKKNKGRLMPYLRNPNVRWFDVDTTDLQMMPFEDHEHERYGLKAGDIVICEGGEAGRAAIWDGRLPDLKFQKAIHRVRPGPRLHNRFFVHRLMADHQNGRLGDYLTGATIKHFTGQDLARYEIPLPPLAEQRRIAEVLDRAEALRAKRRAALAELDSLTQSLFLDMFGDPATNPKGWPKQKLGDIAKQITDGEHQTPKRTTHGIKLLSARNVRDGFIDVTDVDYVSQEEHDRIKRRCNPEKGDVLISCSGTIGRVATVSTTEPFSLVRSVALIKPKGDIVDSTFLENHLRTPALHSKMQRSANASSQANLFQGQIRELPTTLPPITMQREFARRVTAVEALKTAHRASLAELDALFATLQHLAFRGEL